MNHPPPSKSLSPSHSSSPSPSTSFPSHQATPPLRPPFPPRLPPSLPNGGDRTTIASAIHIHDLPEPILKPHLLPHLRLRSRNAMSLATRKWLLLERSTRSALSLRDCLLFLIRPPQPLLPLPLGPPLPPPHANQDNQYRDRDGSAGDDDEEERHLIVRRLHRVFPNLTSLVVYARYPSTLDALLPLWTPPPPLRQPRLSAPPSFARTPRHQTSSCSSAPALLYRSCPALAYLDLSFFYCWTENLLLHSAPPSPAAVARLQKFEQQNKHSSYMQLE